MLRNQLFSPFWLLLPYSTDLSLAVPLVLSSLEIDQLRQKPPKSLLSPDITKQRRSTFPSSLTISREGSIDDTTSERS